MADGSLDMISEAGEPGTARVASRRSPQENLETSGSTQAPGEQSAPAASPGRWRRPLLIMGPVALVIGALRPLSGKPAATCRRKMPICKL